MVLINIVYHLVYLKIIFGEKMIVSELQICFIGNAIVDIISTITDENLDELKIPKGSMQLVDEKLSNKILDYIKKASLIRNNL